MPNGIPTGELTGPYLSQKNTYSELNVGPLTKMYEGSATITNGTKVVTVTLKSAFSFASATSYRVVATEQKAGDASAHEYAIEYVSGTQFKIHSDSNTGTL